MKIKFYNKLKNISNKFDFFKFKSNRFSIGKIEVDDIDENNFFDKNATDEYKKKVEEHYKRIECKQ